MLREVTSRNQTQAAPTYRDSGRKQHAADQRLHVIPSRTTSVHPTSMKFAKLLHMLNNTKVYAPTAKY